MKKIFTQLLLIVVLFVGTGTIPARAEIISDEFASQVTTTTGIGATARTPVDTVLLIIEVLLSLLGVIALVVIIYAGVLWMTAGGNEDRVKEAKGLLRGAVIGGVIILGSYSIAQFIFSTIEGVTGQGAIGMIDHARLALQLGAPFIQG